MEKLDQRTDQGRRCTRAMEIKVFGGGNVTDTSNAVGSDNAEFVLRYLEAEGLRCVCAGSRRNVAAAY